MINSTQQLLHICNKDLQQSLAQLKIILSSLSINSHNIYFSPENQANKDMKSQYSITQNQTGK